MEIHLIRHGKTLANEQRLYCGQTDLQLSENGVNELLDLKVQGIYPTQACLYFTSGLLRTEQTLDLLYGPVQREALSALREFDFGDFEMKSHSELKERPDYQAWISDNSGFSACPYGESKQNFLNRIMSGFEVLCEKTKKVESSLIICHGGVIASIMGQLFPNSCNFYEWQPNPGHGYSLIYLSNRLIYKKIYANSL